MTAVDRARPTHLTYASWFRDPADLRTGWGAGGVSASPTSAWTFDDDAIAKFDFDDE